MGEIRPADQMLKQDGATNGAREVDVVAEIRPKQKKSRGSRDAAAANKRRCVSTACIACRRRKSKCDGIKPSCAACSSVYGTECVYDPNSDHRRKGVYKERNDSLKTKSSTLQTLVHAILNYAEEDIPALVQQIRTCENLDDVADNIVKQEQGLEDEEEDHDEPVLTTTSLPIFETELSGKMGELRLENGSLRFLGGTSNLILLDATEDEDETAMEAYQQQDFPLTSWTTVTAETEVVVHLINMYFTWHYPFFTTLSKSLFYRDFLLGKPPGTPKRTMYCSSLLVNAMLALGCHFTNSPAGCADPNDSATKGDAFFAEAKRLIVENDEYEKPKLTTVQALCLMSVREAGCGRDAKGWVYSGMAFRMAQDMGLNLDTGVMTTGKETMDEREIDARRVTFWACFLFDKIWSNYMGRLPQLPVSNITVPKFDVFPVEDADIWSPYTDNGIGTVNSQASRTRTIALQLSSLCEISSDLLIFFYHPHHLERSVGRAQELKKLGELQTRLEAWRKDLPKELEAKEGQLPNVIIMHMFFHLAYIHLFRPFLKYNPTTSPLPSHVSPKKLCTQAASSISKLMRLYKRTYGLRQICNIANYIVHTACTIHLLNLPEKTAKRDIVHGIKHLEEIAEDWLCARRSLSVLSLLARKWKVELPEEAANTFMRTDHKYGSISTASSPKSEIVVATPPHLTSPVQIPRPIQNNFDSLMSQADVSNNIYGLNPNIQVPSLSSTVNVAAAPVSHSYIKSFTPVQASQNGQAGGVMNHINGSTKAISHPQQPYGNASTRQPAPPNHDIRRSEPSGMSDPISAAKARQVSPTAFLGGVDASLLDSQDWWIKDQASLAVGFDNWVGVDMNGDNQPANGNGNRTGSTTNNSTSPEMMANEFFVPSENGDFPDIDWSTYT